MNKYRVYIGQVNQTYVDVLGSDSEDAADRAYRKWRKEVAHAAILRVESIASSTPDGETIR